MKHRITATAIAASILALGFGLSPSAGTGAESGRAADVLQRACGAVAGRFEQTWAHRETDIEWHVVASCVTEDIRLTCQGDICRSAHLARDRQAAILVKHKASPDLGQAVLPGRNEFDRVLQGRAIH